MSDSKKQDGLRAFYESSGYYSNRPENFADRMTRFNRVLVRNVLGIYCAGEGEKVLDAGCGWGNISLALQKRGADVTGLDYAEESIRICRETAGRLGLDPGKFVCRDASETGFEDGSFETVYCADLVEHLFPEVYLGMIREFHRILKPAGRLVIYTPNPRHLFEVMKKHGFILKRDAGHVDLKTRPFLERSLKDNGFAIVRSYDLPSHWPILGLLERSLMPVAPFLRRRIAVLAVKAGGEGPRA